MGDGLLGRVVDPLGNPLDGSGPLTRVQGYRCLECASPPITARDFVHAPLYTGSRIIDTLIPIGKGQRQLIVGDAGLGRSSLAMRITSYNVCYTKLLRYTAGHARSLGR